MRFFHEKYPSFRPTSPTITTLLKTVKPNLMFLITIAIYVFIQMAIAVYVSRGTKSDDDYLVAGRKLGVWAVALSLFATWFAAETVIATTAEVAEIGLAGARIEPFAYGMGIVILGLFVAGRMRKGGYITVADFMRERFGGSAEGLCAIAIVVSATVWASAQLFALAILISTSSDLSFHVALIASTAVVLMYTLFGGLMGDVATDMIQGVILSIGVGILLVLALDAAGGISAAINSIPAERLSFNLPDESWLDRFEIWIIPIVGTITAQEAVSRTLAARTPEIARRGALLGAGIYVLVGFIPVSIGFIGPHLGLELGVGDAFTSSLAHALMPGWVYIIFVGALLSAILSSVDSALLSVSAVLTESGYRRFRPGMSERESLWAARSTTVFAGLIAFTIAASGSGVRELVEAASVIAGSYAVTMLIGLSTRKGGAITGTLSVLVAVVLLIWLSWIQEIPGGFVFALLGSAITYIAIAIFEPKMDGPDR